MDRGVYTLDAIEALARQFGSRQLASTYLFGGFNEGEHGNGHYATGRLFLAWHFSQTP
jgi:hypothetical protein